jgi:hypothetical protein
MSFTEAINTSKPLAFKTVPSFDESGDQTPLKWSQPNGKESGIEISYAFAEGSSYGNLSLDKVKSLFSEALSVWSQYAPLNFKEVADPGQDDAVDIRIKSENIDGPKETLAYAYFPNAGDITFDQSEQWSESLFLETAVHEIGHAMGLDHEGETEAVMNSVLTGRYEESAPYLLNDDIEGIRGLYGSGKGSVNALNGAEDGSVNMESQATEFDAVTPEAPPEVPKESVWAELIRKENGAIAPPNDPLTGQNATHSAELRWHSEYDSSEYDSTVQGNNIAQGGEPILWEPFPSLYETDSPENVALAPSKPILMGISQSQNLGSSTFSDNALSSDCLVSNVDAITNVNPTGFV